MAGNEKIKKRGDDPGVFLRAGIAVTILWLVFIFFFLAFNTESIWGAKPNEFGDFLAGALAPLAFFWLVIGLLYQGHELRQNQEALLLQADELKKSVKQHTKQAAAQQGHEKYMRQSVLNDTRQIFEQDLAECARGLRSYMRMSQSQHNHLQELFSNKDFFGAMEYIVGIVNSRANVFDHLGENDGLTAISRRYNKHYQYSVDRLNELDEGDYCREFYDASFFGQLDEIIRNSFDQTK